MGLIVKVFLAQPRSGNVNVKLPAPLLVPS